MADLGLSEHHHQQAISYIRFTRFKRAQRLKGVERCFQDLRSVRLYEDVYTLDEVNELLDGLYNAVHSEMESEFLNSSHTSTLLLKQLLVQAEKWHLKLNCDVAELENREMLEQIAEFEKKEMTLSGLEAVKLDPVNEKGGVGLLHREIDRLGAQNRNYLDVIKKLQANVVQNQENNKKLLDQVKSLGGTPVVDLSALKALEAKVKEIQQQCAQELERTGLDKNAIAGDLTNAKHDLLRVQEQLELAEKELEKKFHQTTGFKNLKDILLKKNEQLKDMRKKLSKYEPVSE